ncbi:hypothetical protein ACFLIM_25960 [Nonomuraea sp. M3C6]|uniref:Uncharacterized protein n=1 Tax=Nonomuraea marmarensis TaxID=3351344 RepID=A0ABW7AH03_9ACTN
MTTKKGAQQRTDNLPEIEWARSPGSLFREIGWVGLRQIFSLVDRKHEFGLHIHLVGRNGITLPSEVFGVSCEQPREQAQEKARARAQEVWRAYLLDLATPRGAQERRAS